MSLPLSSPPAHPLRRALGLKLHFCLARAHRAVAETEGPDAKDAKTHKRIMTLRLGSPTFVSWVASDARIDRAVCDMLQRVNRLASPEWLANHWLFAGLRDDSRQRISRLFQPTVFDSESPLIAPALEETGPTYKRPRTRAFVVVYGTVKGGRAGESRLLVAR